MRPSQDYRSQIPSVGRFVGRHCTSFTLGPFQSAPRGTVPHARAKRSISSWLDIETLRFAQEIVHVRCTGTLEEEECRPVSPLPSQVTLRPQPKGLGRWASSRSTSPASTLSPSRAAPQILRLRTQNDIFMPATIERPWLHPSHGSDPHAYLLSYCAMPWLRRVLDLWWNRS